MGGSRELAEGPGRRAVQQYYTKRKVLVLQNGDRAAAWLGIRVMDERVGGVCEHKWINRQASVDRVRQ